MTQDNLYCIPDGLLPKKIKDRPQHRALIDRYDMPTGYDPNKPSAVYLANNDGMVGFYRSMLPARELSRLAKWKTTLAAEVWRPSLKEIVADASVIVFSVPYDEDTLQRVPKWGKRALIVVDIDDNLFELPKHNDSYLFWDRVKSVLDRYLKAADIITTPSLDLKEYLEAKYARVYYVPNTLDMQNPTWREPMITAYDGTLVGFAGSMSHLYDLKMLEEPLRRVMARVPGWEFVVYGPLELYHAIDLPKDRYRWFPARPYDCWPSLLRHLTIGICPLEDTLFNRCKSCLKVIETSAAGVMPLASRVGPFVHFEAEVRQWAKGKGWPESEEVMPMFTGPDSFAHTLELMLTSPDLFNQRQVFLSEYANRFCTSEQFSRLEKLFAAEYRNKFLRPISGARS